MQNNQAKVVIIKNRSNKKLWIPLIIISILAIILLTVGLVENSELKDYQGKLADTQNQLSDTENNLSDVTVKLTNTQQQLTSRETELVTKQSELAAVQLQLDSVQGQLESEQAQLALTQQQLVVSQTEAGTLQSELTDTQAQLDAIQMKYQNVTTGYAYVLNDPTYAEMQSFIAADNTDLRKYNADTYNCQNYSADVITNAAKQKIRCAFVSIDYTNSGHAIVAFNTTDRGLVYIEPQSDKEVKLSVGGHYYQEIITKPGYYYPTPSYDDTVKRFLVIW